jgi:hypothetical protein
MNNFFKKWTFSVSSSKDSFLRKFSLPHSLVIFVLLFGLFIVNNRNDFLPKDVSVDVKKIIPAEIANRLGKDLYVDKKVYSRIFPNELVVRKYESKAGKGSIYLTVVISNDRSHIHDPEVCYKLQGFDFSAKKIVRLSSGMRVCSLSAVKENEKYSFIYWYTNTERQFDSRLSFFLDHFWNKCINKPVLLSGIIILYSDSDNYFELAEFSDKLRVIMDKNINTYSFIDNKKPDKNF